MWHAEKVGPAIFDTYFTNPDSLKDFANMPIEFENCAGIYVFKNIGDVCQNIIILYSGRGGNPEVRKEIWDHDSNVQKKCWR